MAKKGFEFQFKNPVQDSGDALTNVLFINDTPSESDILRLVATAVPDVTVTLKPVADKVVSKTNYHFKLTCRPDTLAQPTEILLDASHAALWGMVCIPETAAAASADGERAPGDVDFYFLYKGTAALEVNTDNPLSLTLRKVGAASKGGTRPTINQLTLNKKETDFDKFVTFAGPPGDYNLTENANLDLLAPRNLAVPTLMAGFVSSDIVLNDGDTENYLLLRIVNTGLLPITLAPEGSASPSKLTLRFAADNTTSQLWALGTIAQVSNILIPGKADSTATDPSWSGKDAWTVTARANEQRWELKPKAAKITLAPDEAIEVPISKIVTSHATGRTALRIAYSGLPGFGDGELVAFIQKYPLVYADHLIKPGKPDEKRHNWIGVGTDSPSAKLTVETAAGEQGITVTDGTVKLVAWAAGETAVLSSPEHPLLLGAGDTRMTLTTDGKVGINTLLPPSDALVVVWPSGYGITHTSGTVKVSTRVDETSGHLGTQTKHPLSFFTDGSAPQMTLTTDGKLGIGTSSPSHMLTVQTNGLGIAHTNGTVTLTTGLDGTGAALGTTTNHELRFFTGPSVKMTLTTDGNLGIGTTTPSEKLHVAGHLGITGDFTKPGGPFVFWPNTDKVANADLLRFMDQDGNTALQLKSDGRLWLKTKPIEFVTYSTTADNPRIHTGYKTAEWTAVIAGFLSRGDGNTGKTAGVNVWTHIEGGFWQISCDLQGIEELEWWVRVIFIRNDLVQGRGHNYVNP